MKKLTLLATALWLSAVVAAADYPRVDEEVASFDQRAAFLRQGFAKHPVAPNNKDWVKRKLQHMMDLDSLVQDSQLTPARSHFTDKESLEFDQRMRDRYSQIMRQNAVDFRKLLELYAWFPISEFGAGADDDAWLLVEHGGFDTPFLSRLLTILEPLAARRETNPVKFAYLFDHLVEPQRYGTKGGCSERDAWEPLPVEDPENLDARRAQVGLPPMAEAQKQFSVLCRSANP